MPIQSKGDFEQVILGLSVLRYMLKANAKAGRHDLAKQAESFFRDLLNLTMGWELELMESIQRNYPAIDLADRSERLCVQVTAANRASKISGTLARFRAKQLDRRFDRLIFLILSDKKTYQKDFGADAAPFAFNQAKDIWDIDDVLSHVESLDAARLHQVADLVRREITAVIAGLAAKGSVFLSAEQRVDTAPKTANAFLTACGYDDLDDKHARAERASVNKVFKRLRDVPRDARGMLALVVARGIVRTDSYQPLIGIMGKKLDSLLSGQDTVQLYGVLEEAGFADVDGDHRLERIRVSAGLASGQDFFVQAKAFLGDADNCARIRRLIEDCDFTVLD